MVENKQNNKREKAILGNGKNEFLSKLPVFLGTLVSGLTLLLLVFSFGSGLLGNLGQPAEFYFSQPSKSGGGCQTGIKSFKPELKCGGDCFYRVRYICADNFSSVLEETRTCRNKHYWYDKVKKICDQHPSCPPSSEVPSPDRPLPSISPSPLESATPLPLPSLSCTEEGGILPVYPGYHCCPGLTAVPPNQPDVNGNCGQTLLGASICTKCGDGSCGKGENLCNCPVDCPSSVSPNF
jgi:hypothetical protein